MNTNPNHRPAFRYRLCKGCNRLRAINENGDMRLHKGDNRGPITNSCSEGDPRADQWVAARQAGAAYGG